MTSSWFSEKCSRHATIISLDALPENLGVINRYIRSNSRIAPDTKVHRANMGLTWDLSPPCRPHVGPMNLAIRGPCWLANHVRGHNKQATEISLGLGSANERRRYIVTSSFTGWAHTQNDPCAASLAVFRFRFRRASRLLLVYTQNHKTCLANW